MDSTWTMFEAKRLGVRLRFDPDLGKIKARPSSSITPGLRRAIKENREELIKDLLIRDAHEFLAGSYVEGADLSTLDGWHEVIGQAYLDSDPEMFRIAVRGYARAGLMAFAQAKKEVAA